ncbi:GmrSD restriction endonuclease domain-containing protein [Pluralibacter gergoviae]|uniref:GmrSD restriction endonuclease domain-containing protein n=1 Tax=Pluralibacter gergoviae TaxID=61647 RepID=UPI000A38D5A8|nr:DUF262 domain-containing protein [Pluralibacter gergoviae]EKV3546388.1 DUF262 domain-containing protein [Pluralibacter gergoviae]OUF47588.1 hypothetical protein AZ034_002104 [Pluralibacter gergoviae]HDS1079916.1 DUF262 domain-containing protein [Pluralibacter gergoviae]
MAELLPQTTSIQTIYSWFTEGKIFVNRRYQRKLVWTAVEKQKLIESIQKRYPIPAVLLAERENDPGTYEIIDGLQRLHAIMSFIETGYESLEGKRFNLDAFPTAKNRANEGKFAAVNTDNVLSQRDVTQLLDYSLAMSIMRNATEHEINDVFDRINTYGHRLSDQERRQAGIQNKFSNMVREIACSLRGDVSDDILLLEQMPSISVDLPLTKHGYQIQSEDVFWVKHGILRSTDLRDSMDEQCIADITACIVGGRLINRSKDALDLIYNNEEDEYNRISSAINVYGEEKFTEEFKFCIQEIIKVCNSDGNVKLRDLIFTKRTTNAFPAIFAVLFIAFHELLIKENKKINNYKGVRDNLNNVVTRLDTKRSATSEKERRKNINSIIGLIKDNFIDNTDNSHIYNSHNTIDIEDILRRSEIELANYELKQGLLTLGGKRGTERGIHEKIFTTICAIAKIGKGNKNGIIGKLLIGVTDKTEDALRVKALDNIDAHVVGLRSVVGVKREAEKLNISMEEYYRRFCDKLKQSNLSEPLKSQVIGLIDYNDFYGYGVIVITIPVMTSYSSYNGDIYYRSADNTKKATVIEAADIATRFK